MRDLETIIVLVLHAIHFIHQRLLSTNLDEARIRDTATVTLTPVDGTTTIKVELNENEPISSFSRMEKSYEVFRVNNNGPETLTCGTPDTTLTITCCDRFDRNRVNIDCTEPPIPTEQS